MGFAESYNYVIEELGDPRTADYFFSHSPWPMLMIVVSYLLFVIYIGPKLMQNIPPIEIQRIVTIYNIFQIVLNGYMFISALITAFIHLRYSLLCQPVGSGTSPDELHIIKLVWLYHMIKIFDLLDTVFIILRKKSSQLSVLHIYHHAGMVIASWIGLKFVPGGQSVLTGAINCFVHAVMYSYYLLTTMNSRYRSSWWKKHITQLQFGQFAIVALHHTFAIFDTECTYPKLVSYLLIPPEMLLTYMFVDYYQIEYTKKIKQ